MHFICFPSLFVFSFCGGVGVWAVVGGQSLLALIDYVYYAHFDLLLLFLSSEDGARC